MTTEQTCVTYAMVAPMVADDLLRWLETLAMGDFGVHLQLPPI